MNGFLSEITSLIEKKTLYHYKTSGVKNMSFVSVRANTFSPKLN